MKKPILDTLFDVPPCRAQESSPTLSTPPLRGVAVLLLDPSLLPKPAREPSRLLRRFFSAIGRRLHDAPFRCAHDSSNVDAALVVSSVLLIVIALHRVTTSEDSARSARGGVARHNLKSSLKMLAMLVVVPLGCGMVMPTRSVSQPRTLDTIEVDEEIVIGEGTYGVVYSARESDTGREFVAKRSRDDALSRKYFAIEKALNEQVARWSPASSLYAGLVRKAGKLPAWLGGGFKEYLLFERVVGGRDLGTYIEEGACGLDSLGAALGLGCIGDECMLDANDDACFADPDLARSGTANVLVAATVMDMVLTSLIELQGAGVCHRDVKPANMLIDPLAQTVRLIDLGSGLNVETKLGYDAKRSPVSPRYCPPEQFVDETNWRSFDVYSLAVSALRVMLSPALRTNKDLDEFNAEFARAGHRLDTWLGSKLAAKAVPTRLLAPLSALSSSSSNDWDSAAKAFWRLLCRMTVADPAQRVDVLSAAQAARDVLRRLTEAAAPVPESPPFIFLSPHDDDNTVVRLTVAAPLGVVVEDTSAGPVVAQVQKKGNAAKLGRPKVGDRLLQVEWTDGVSRVETVDDVLESMRAIERGALFEVTFVDNAPPAVAPVGPRRELRAARCGAYRRRGTARAAIEDAVAIASSTFADFLDARDWPNRPVTAENLASRDVRLTKHDDFVLAVVADGHGGQVQTHCARRLPELVAEALPTTPSLEQALRAAWTRCAEEYVSDDPGGAVVAAICIRGQDCAVLHCGDTRLVASQNRADVDVVFATSDHSLRVDAEVDALLKRGASLEAGRVVADQWRVAVPRALGGTIWRQAGITPAADTTVLDPTMLDHIIIASDGLWDVLSSREAALYVRARRLFRSNDSPTEVARHLADRAAALGSGDDISVAILFLDHIDKEPPQREAPSVEVASSPADSSSEMTRR